jgi:hypothetical protein
MSVETLNDPNNRRTQLSVTENYACVLVAPVSGYLFTNAV